MMSVNMFWPFRRYRLNAPATWDKRLEDSVKRLQLVENSRETMAPRDFSHYVRMRTNILKSEARRARIACGIATVGDMELEHRLNETKMEVDTIIANEEKQ